jgi:hypothetical protein
MSDVLHGGGGAMQHVLVVVLGSGKLRLCRLEVLPLLAVGARRTRGLSMKGLTYQMPNQRLSRPYSA